MCPPSAFGLAASTAAIVLAAGTRGKRLAMPNTRIMMHQPMGGASGQAIDVEIQAKEIMYHKNNLTRIVAQITGNSFEKVRPAPNTVPNSTVLKHSLFLCRRRHIHDRVWAPGLEGIYAGLGIVRAGGEAHEPGSLRPEGMPLVCPRTNL